MVVVILDDLSHERDKALVYIGMSRARAVLVVIAVNSGEPS